MTEQPTPEPESPGNHDPAVMGGFNIADSVKAWAPPAGEDLVPDASKAARDIMGIHDDRAQLGVAKRFEIEARNLKLHREATTDSLTGLMRKDYWLKKFSEAVEDYQEGDELVVSYGDGDGFKTTNDTLGHAAGDRLLGLFAQAFLAVHNRGDIQIARLGGDEFTVLERRTATEIADKKAALEERRTEDPEFVDRRPTDPLERAAHLSDRVNEELQKLLATDEGAEFRSVPVSISIGSAVFIPGVDTAETLLARAEADMYVKKYAGKSEQWTPDDKDALALIMPVLLNFEARGLTRVDPVLKNAAGIPLMPQSSPPKQQA